MLKLFVFIFISTFLYSGQAQAEACSPPNTSNCYTLQLHYTFSEGSGQQTTDISGNNRNGTLLNNPTWMASGPNNYLNFTRANQTNVQSPAFVPPADGVVAFWLKIQTIPSTRQRIFGFNDAWEIRWDTDNVMYLDINKGGSNNSIRTSSAITTTNQWMHFAVVTSATNNTWEVYIDGVLDNSGTETLTAVATAEILSIGNRTGASDYLDGSVDDFRIYSGVLTASEIAELAAESPDCCLAYPYETDFEGDNTEWTPENEWAISSSGHGAWQANSGSKYLDNNPSEADQEFHYNRYIWLNKPVYIPFTADQPTLSFYYKAAIFSGQVYTQISTNGSSWSYLETYTDTSNHSNYTKREINLESYKGESVQIRFMQHFGSGSGARLFVIDDLRIGDFQSDNYAYPYSNGFESADLRTHFNYEGDWDSSQAHDTQWFPSEGSYFLDNNYNNEDQADHRNHYATMNGFITLPDTSVNPMISFDYISEIFDGLIYLQVQEYGSNNWSTLKTFREEYSFSNHTPYTKYEHNLASYLGKKVRFRFQQYWYSSSGSRTFAIDNIFVGDHTNELAFPYANGFETVEEQSQWYPDGDWGISTAHDTNWFPSSGSSFLDNNVDNEDQALHREHYATMAGYVQLPADSSNVVVSYDYLSNLFDSQAFLYIQKLGQTNWTHIKTYNDTFNRSEYATEEISLSSYAGEKVRFAFRQYHNSTAGARVFAIDNFEIRYTTTEEYDYPYLNNFETPISTANINGQDQWAHIGDWGISQAHDGVYIPESGAYFLDNNFENKDQRYHREHYTTMKGFVTLPEAPANPMISFDYLSDIFNGQVYLNIQEEGSSSWINLKTFTDEFNHKPHTKYEYDLSNYAGKKVRFRFRQYWNDQNGPRVFPIDNVFIGELTETLPFPYANDFETAEEQAQWYPDGDWNISTAHDSRWYPSSGTSFLDNNYENEDQSNHREHFATMSGYIPLPEDSSNVVVSFDYLLDTFDGQFYIYIQKLGQTDWTYLKIYQEEFNRSEYTRDEISLASYAGEQVRFRFRQYHFSSNGARVFAIDNFKVEQVTLENYGYPYFNDFETPISTSIINGQDHWDNIGDWGISQEHDTLYAPQAGEFFLDNNINNEDQASHRNHYATMNGFVTLPAAPENPMLSFDYTSKIGGGTAYVDIQELGSNTWVTLDTFNETEDHTPYTKFEYFLGNYAEKTIRIRFRQYWDSTPGPRVFTIDNFFIGELTKELTYPYANSFETEEEQAEWQAQGDWAVGTEHDTHWYPQSGSYFLDGNAGADDQANHREHYATLSGYIQLPEDTSAVAVSFDYLLNTFEGQPYIQIQKFGENSWSNLRTYTDKYNHDGYVHEEFALTNYAGEKVRFRFRQYYYNVAGPRTFGVDNFKVGEIDLPDYQYPYFNDFETPTSTPSINGQDHWSLEGDWNISTEHDSIYIPKNGSNFLDNNAGNEDQSSYKLFYASLLGYVPITNDANNPQLSFWYNADIYNGTILVEIQEKGSNNWTNIQTFTEQNSHNGYTKFYYDLDAYQGRSIRARIRQYWYADSGARVFTVDDFRIGDDDRINLSYPYENTFESIAEREQFIADGDWGISTEHDTNYVPYEGSWFIDNNAEFEDQQVHRQHYITLADYIPIPSNANVPTVSFWYKADNFDYASYIEIRRKGETSWSNLFTFTEDKNHDEYVKFEMHLDSYKGDEVTFRFRQYWNSTSGPRTFVVDNFRVGDLIQDEYVFPYYNDFDIQISTATNNGRDHWNTEHDWKISDQNTVTGTAESGDWFLDNNPDAEDQQYHRNQYATMHGFVPIPADAVNPKVSFDYVANLFNGSAYIQIQKAGSSTWTNLKTFTSNDNTATYENYSNTLDSYKGESVRFRFRQYFNSTSGERVFNVDNFTVDQELLGIWYFEENWEDSTGNGFDLSPVNTPIFDDTTRAKDGAIGSDTSTCFYTGYENDQYAIATDTAAQNHFNALTVSVWINPAAYNTNLSTILTKGDDFAIYLNSAGNIQWQYLGSQLTSSTAIPLNQWTHIALTFKDGEQYIYINGTSVASASVSGVLTDLDEDIYVAADLNNATNSLYSDRYFQGTIDELRVYRIAQNSSAISTDMDVLHPCDISITPDHYRIEHDGIGLTCAAETVTIKACNDAQCTDLNIEPKTLSFIVESSDADTITSTITFTGSTEVTFNHTSPTPVELSIINDVNSPSINNFQCIGGTAEAPCSMLFSDAELRFLNNNNIDDIEHQTSGSNFTHSIQIQAVKDNNGVCENLFVNQNTNISFQQENTTGATSGLSFTINGTNIPRSGYQDVTLNFGSDGIATIPSPVYNDAGEIRLHAKYDQDGVNLVGVTNNFWVKPYALDLEATFNSPHIAGSNFSLKVTPLNANNGVPENYKQNDIHLTVERLTPNSPASPTGPDYYTGGVDGVFTYNGASVDLSSPQALILNPFVLVDNTLTSTSDDVSYSEVGTISIDIEDLNYGGISGFDIPSSGLIEIGAFIPDHFDVALDSNGQGAFENTCTLGATDFTYTGQAFGYKIDTNGTVQAPQLIITAKNANNVTTQNYTESEKLSVTDIERSLSTADSIQNGADGLAKVTITPTPDNNGTLTRIRASNDGSNIVVGGSIEYRFSENDRYTYDQNTNALIDKFTSDYTITIERLRDSDGVTAIPSDTAQISDLPLSFSPDPIEIRYGRLTLADNFGPETSDLPITLSAQYWNGTQFVLNTADRCTTYDSANLQVTNASLTSVRTSDGTLDDGSTNLLILRAPGADNQGNTEVIYDTSLTPWLQFDWNENGTSTDPSANAVFGVFRGNDRIISWREVFQ